MKNFLFRACILLSLIGFFDLAHSQEPQLLPVTLFDIYELKDVMGYIDTTGRIAIDPQFEFADKFEEGLAVVKTNGKYGAIDGTGKLIVRPIYDYVWRFTDGLCRVQLDKKIGFVDQLGNEVIKPIFTEAGGFQEGLAAVKIGDKVGFIDKTGKVVITPAYASVKAFSEGLAAVKLMDAGRLWGFIDKTGSMVIKPQFEGWTAADITSFKDGLAIAQRSDNYSSTYWYVINKKGEVILDTKIKYIENPTMHNFSDGLAVFGKGDPMHSGLSPGFIDLKGNITRPLFRPPKYNFEDFVPSEIGDFHDGRAYIKIGEKWGFIRPDLTFAYDPHFEGVQDYGFYARGIVTFKLDGKWCHRSKDKLIFDGRNAKWDSKEHKMTK